MISRFDSFIEDKLLESLVNESFLYYSPNVRKNLIKIKENPIASELLSAEGTDIKPDMTFIDLGKEGFLSFITMKNAAPLIKNKFPDRDWATNIENEKLPDNYADTIYDYGTTPGGPEVYLKSRNEVALGKFVNKLFPGKFNDKQREEFVNNFKSAVEKSGEYFDEVIGEDIEEWYSYEKYKEMSGTLGNSCMAKKSGFFEIYTQNQDVCRMLILVEDDKLIGRALVWKIHKITRPKDKEFEYFMDRQYVIKDSDVRKFRIYAEQEGWAYKAYNNHHSLETVKFNGEEFTCKMQVKIAKKSYDAYPYMDTFKRLDPSEGILYNDDENDSDYEGCYILEDTGGGYTEVESGIWSDWHDRRISEDESVYSEYLGDSILRDYAVEVTRGSRGNRGWYPEDHDDVVRANDGEYYNVNDCIYSGIYGEHIYEGDAVSAIVDIYSDGEIDSIDDNYVSDSDGNYLSLSSFSNSTWFEKVSEKYSEWNDYQVIDRDLLVKDLNDKWCPKIFTTTVYKIVGPKDESTDLTGVEYLTEIDALAFNYDIDNEKLKMDWFSYTNEIEAFLGELELRLESLKDYYKSILDGKGQLRLNFSEDDEQEYKQKINKLYRRTIERLESIDNQTWN